MVSCCINPACCAEYRLFDGGELYAVERSVGMEFFWLCPDCALVFAVYRDPMGQMSLKPRSVSGGWQLYGEDFLQPIARGIGPSSRRRATVLAFPLEAPPGETKSSKAASSL
jgi:hypothetical protein